ncbi:phosphopantetheine-binding protein, partial [Acinetobacter baumannii]
MAQARMAEVWAGLLGVATRASGLADNFFDLGGNSLLVMQAVAEAERVLGLQLDPRRFVYEPLGQLVPAAA